MSGGNRQQKDAAAAQAQLSREQAGIARENQQMVKDQYAKINPFATDRLNNGLPFFNALTDFNSAQQGQAWSPVKADILRRTNAMGDLPSGFREAQLNNVDAMRARAFDQGQTNNLLMNEQSKQDAARLLTGQQQILNPLGYFQGAQAGNQSIMQMPQQQSGLAGMLGGAVGNLADRAIKSIPF